VYTNFTNVHSLELQNSFQRQKMQPINSPEVDSPARPDLTEGDCANRQKAYANTHIVCPITYACTHINDMYIHIFMVANNEGKPWKEMPNLKDGDEDCLMNGVRESSPPPHELTPFGRWSNLPAFIVS